MMSSTDKASLVRQSSLSPSQLRGLSDEAPRTTGLTGGGRKVATTDRRHSFDLGRSDRSGQAKQPLR